MKRICVFCGSKPGNQDVFRDQTIALGRGLADRRYELDKTLMSRKHDDAVIHNVDEVLDQVERITFQKNVVSHGEELVIDSQTICLHSDTKGAVTLAKEIHDHLERKGATIAAV